MTQERYARVLVVTFCAVLAALLLSAIDSTVKLHGTAYALTTADCRSCHTGGSDADLTSEHHALYTARTYTKCSSCHNKHGITRNCTACHPATSHNAAHDKTFFTSNPADTLTCQSCHTGMAISLAAEHSNHGFSCSTCHSSTNPVVQAAIEKGKGSTGQPVYCADCHATSGGSHELAHDKAFFTANTADTALCQTCHTGMAIGVVTEHANYGFGCAICHDNTNPAIQTAIAKGKGLAGQPVYCADCHTDLPSGSSPHDAQHDMINATACSTCHADMGTNIVSGHAVYGFGCTTCHSSTSLDVQTAIANGRAGQTVYCADCHTAVGVPSHETQHNTINSTVCSSCHNSFATGFVAAHVAEGFTCATCHSSTDMNIQNAISNGRAGQTVYCADCHTAVGVPSHETQHDRVFFTSNTTDAADCNICHIGYSTGVAPNLIQEHTAQGLSCATCHSSIDPNIVNTIAKGSGTSGAPLYCSDCHLANNKHEHNMVFFTLNSSDTTVCQSCHTGMATSVAIEHARLSLSCATCHSSTDPAVQSTIASGSGVNGQPVYCATCHTAFTSHDADHDKTTFTPNATDTAACQYCHTDFATGFATAHASQGLGCSNCHSSTDQNVIAAIDRGDEGAAGQTVYCNDCHTPFSHETQHDKTLFTDNSADIATCSATGCHTGMMSSIVQEHRNEGFGCSVCHVNSDPVILNAIMLGSGSAGQPVYCVACHTNLPSGSNPHDAQHDKVTFTANSADFTTCSATGCHTGMTTGVVKEHANRGYSCSACHSSTDQMVITAITNGKAGTTVYCTSCHYDAYKTAKNYGIHNASHNNVCAKCHTDMMIGGVHAGRSTVICISCHKAKNATTAQLNSIFTVQVNATPGEPPDTNYTAAAYFDKTSGPCMKCHNSDIWPSDNGHHPSNVQATSGCYSPGGVYPAGRCHFTDATRSQTWPIPANSYKGNRTWGHVMPKHR
ncbi:MAG: hypothetical protein AB1553_16045 [Nitrospirota bacterium]